MGTGWVLPIKAKINSFTDLKKKAQKMGEAEGFDNGFSKNWGSVALLFNPNKAIGNDIKKSWSGFMSRQLSNRPLLNANLKTEESSINSNGFLTIKWPKEVTSESNIDKLDFLIATVTKPTLIKGRYPTIYQIADVMKEANYYEYFYNNRKYGITTFQDERILKRLKKITRHN